MGGKPHDIYPLQKILSKTFSRISIFKDYFEIS
jgi:hypothetical protein